MTEEQVTPIEDAEIVSEEKKEETTTQDIPQAYYSVYRKTFEFGIRQMIEMLIKNIDAVSKEVLNFKPADWQATRSGLIRSITEVASQIRVMPYVVKTTNQDGPVEIVMSLQQEEIVNRILYSHKDFTFKNGDKVITINYEQMDEAADKRLDIMVPWIIGEYFLKTQALINEIGTQDTNGKTNSELLADTKKFLLEEVIPYYENL